MKKIGLLLLCFVILIFSAGCKNKKPTETTSRSTTGKASLSAQSGPAGHSTVGANTVPTHVQVKPQPTSATQTGAQSGYSYRVESNGKTALLKYTGSEKTVAVPKTLGGGLVTYIGKDAFAANTSVTSIVLPDTVETISTGAFKNCTSLQSVVLPTGVGEIGAEAFSGCTSLTSVSLPASLNTLRARTFAGCTALAKVTLRSGLQVIEEEAFYGCAALTDLLFPRVMTEIGVRAFGGCAGLTKVSLPQRVALVDEAAFVNCSGMKSVEIANAKIRIEAHAFGFTTKDNKTYQAVSGFTVRGAKNSAAQQYAKANGLTFAEK